MPAVFDKAFMKIRLVYGFGKMAESVKSFGFGFLFFYYTAVLGLSPLLSGLAVAVAQCFDAISDPTVGSWSDSVKTRWGRRHPFMLASALPLAITFYMLFIPPDGLSEWGLFFWFTTFSILSRTALTLFHVPYLSMGAELSSDYNERTRIVAFRSIFGYAGAFVLTIVGYQVFFVETPEYEKAQLNPAVYPDLGLFAAILIVVIIFLFVWLSRDYHKLMLGSTQKAVKFTLTRVYTDLLLALQNKSFRALFFGAFLLFIYMGIHGTMMFHLATYYWDLKANDLMWLKIAYMVGGVTGLPFTGTVIRFLDKKYTVFIGITMGSICSTAPVMLRLVDLMPENGDPALLHILYVMNFISAFGGSIAGITVSSMMGDISDEHALKHGRRQEGVFFGAQAFSGKATNALGHFLGGLALELIHFPAQEDIVDGVVPAAILYDFGMIYVWVVLITLGSAWAFWGYDLDRTKQAKIVEALAARGDFVLDETTAETAADSAPLESDLAKPESNG